MYQGTLLEFLNMGGSEIVLILVVVLLLFGGKKLPELARGLGKGIREFKDASDGVKREIHRNINAMDLDKEEAEETAVNTHSERHHPTEELPVDEKVEPGVPHIDLAKPTDEKIVTDKEKA
ncbi:sec-independent protein translocase protein TatA [Pedobacter terrae]|uniref:Sec-independent protein translocase protein TatA n=1 Tax=Pedobacter terrae TaxID=405671 RepID=A0A1G7S3R9_9SPHI|nr:twin-arginine translocase TatA/TatE family subunit [Pedobacter terrae]SDG17614.1 sec-independent protein translocase protein TatA [Pedobacter terrae]